MCLLGVLFRFASQHNNFLTDLTTYNTIRLITLMLYVFTDANFPLNIEDGQDEIIEEIIEENYDEVVDNPESDYYEGNN